VSRTCGDSHRSRLAYYAIDRRTVAQIQKSAVKLGKRSTVSRIFHARNDKHTIAAWMSDLDRILQIFQVRPTIPRPPTLLTIHVQTELALHAQVAFSDIRHEVASTRGLVSDIHRTIVNGQEGAGNRDQTVGNHRVPFIEKLLQLHRLESGLRFRL
jgi:hypothetical protein